MKQIEWVLLIISNYVRWMEEAELFSKRDRLPYEKIEEEGIISPVTSPPVTIKLLLLLQM